jgi:hypothetical protein
MAAKSKAKRSAVPFTFWLPLADLEALRLFSARSGDPVSALLRRGARRLLTLERRRRSAP